MRPFLAACITIIAATPLAAQKSAAIADTIRRAAIGDTAERIAGYRITGDTAWALIVDPRKPRVTAAREVRLERRVAAWTRVSERPVPVSPPSPKLPAADTAAVAVPPQGPFPPLTAPQKP